MAPEKMVRMANQIATFFKTQPGTDQPDKVAAHLRDFWEPGMRQRLKDYIVANNSAELDDIVVQAAKQL